MQTRKKNSFTTRAHLSILCFVYSFKILVSVRHDYMYSCVIYVNRYWRITFYETTKGPFLLFQYTRYTFLDPFTFLLSPSYETRVQTNLESARKWAAL